MRLVKLAIISFVFFFLLLTGISLLLPSSTNISRAIDINASPKTVYNYINNTNNWKYWYADYGSSKTFVSPTTTGRAATLTINKTTVTIKESWPGKIKALWQTGKNRPVPGEFNFITKDSAWVTVQWHLTQRVEWYPWQKFASIVSNKIIGPFMEKSLENLKRETEKR